MTRTVSIFDVSDFDGFELAAGQRADFTTVSAADAAKVLARSGRAFTLRDHDGTVLLVAGVAKIDAGYGHAWAFMSAKAGRHMRWLTAKVRDYLNTLMSEQRRVEMLVRADYPPAAKWALRLGFMFEGTLHCAAPDGGDLLRFARVNRAWRAPWDMAA